MITFKQFLKEVFEGKGIFPWKDTNIFSTFAEAKFDSFVVIVDRFDLGGNYSYRVSFADESVSSFGKQVLPTSMRSPSEALKVYNTVGNIIKVKVLPYMKSGDYIYFEATSQRTHKIYARLSQIIAKHINGKYQMVGTSTFKIVKI